MSQPELFDFSVTEEGVEIAHARHSDPETSHEAARSVDANALERIVLGAIKRLGGATIKEVALHTGQAEVSISPRFAPLRKKGLIRATGKRRNPGSRVSAIVWEAT